MTGIELDLSVDATLAAGDTARPDASPSRPAPPDRSINPPFIPITRTVSPAGTVASLATTQGLWLILEDTPSQGKVWNLRAVAVVANDIMTNGVKYTAYIGTRVRTPGQIVTLTAEPSADVAGLYVGGASVPVGAVAEGLDFGRYQTWIRPGESLMILLNPTAAETNWQPSVNVYFDQYEMRHLYPGCAS